MSSSLDTILRAKSIVAYLSSRGIEPAKKAGARLQYYCPLPDHNDKKSPSFTVWTDDEFEKFYCFGCSKCLTIIHLVSYMEGISFREAAKKLSDGLDISIEQDFEFLLQAFDQEYYRPELFPFSGSLSLAEVLLSISSLCYTYTESVNFDDGECGIIDQFLSQIDEDIDSYNYSSLRETLASLPEMLSRRREKYEETKEVRRRE